MLRTLTVDTSRRTEMIDITSRIAGAVRDGGLDEGLAVCHVPHTTAGVTIQENADPDVTADILYKLEALVRRDDPKFRHSEGNSDAHIKASLTGSSVTVLVRNSSLVLGTWQAVYLCEFDGPRSRSLHVKLVKG